MPEYGTVDVEVGRERIGLRLGDSEYTGVPDFGEATLAWLRELGAIASPDQYGLVLCRAAFRGAAREGLEKALAAVEARDGALRLRLHIDPAAPELQRLCWESLLYDEPKRLPRRLGMGRYTPLTRYVAAPPAAPALAPDKVRVLVAIANPEDLGTGEWASYERLDDGAEMAVFRSAFDAVTPRISYTFQVSPASRWAIRTRLQDEGFHVLHLVAHACRWGGDGKSSVLLERDHDERAAPVSREGLAAMFADLDDLRLVVLSGVHTTGRTRNDPLLDVAPAIVRQGIPAVIVTAQPLEPPAAHEFTHRLYQSLLRGGRMTGLVDVAVNQTREAMWFSRDDPGWDWTAPVLFMRGDGRLFQPSASGVPTHG